MLYLVHYILNTLPPPYEPFISYNTHKEKCQLMNSRIRKVGDGNEWVYSNNNCGKWHEFEPSQEKVRGKIPPQYEIKKKSVLISQG